MDMNITVGDQRCYPAEVQQKAADAGDIFILARTNWTLADICREVSGATLRYRVHVLRIVAHGMADHIQLGQEGLRTNNAQTFYNLRGIWVDPSTREVHHSPRIDCHACSSAATTAQAGGPTPRVVIQALANATGVEVRAGEENQPVATLFQFRGQVHTFSPTPPRPITARCRPDPGDVLHRTWYPRSTAELRPVMESIHPNWYSLSQHQREDLMRRYQETVSLTPNERASLLRSRARTAQTSGERRMACELLIREVGFPAAQDFARTIGVELER